MISDLHVSICLISLSIHLIDDHGHESVLLFSPVIYLNIVLWYILYLLFVPENHFIDQAIICICLFIFTRNLSLCLFLLVIRISLFIFTCNSSICLFLPVIHLIDGHRHVSRLFRTGVGVVVILRN